MVTIKSDKEIKLMREACRITSLVYKEIEKIIKPGMSTLELDNFADKIIRANGAIPAQKGYPSGIKGVPPFPATLCISINDDVIHGIPSAKKIIKDGDIVSIDLVVYKDGFNGDAARTFIVGNASAEAKRLVEITKQAFFEGIKYAKPGNRIGDVSHRIGEFVESNGYNVIREFQGHGIGREMHEDPGIPNYGKADHGTKLKPGMTLAIEPMVVAGRRDICLDYDGWTVLTQDGSLSAHYENTILITEKEPEILTLV